MAINRKKIWLTLVSSLLLTPLAAQAQRHDITPQYGNVIGAKYAYGNAQYSAPNPTAKKPHTPFAPVEFDHDWQPFAPADISEYGNGPHRKYGFFASYERLYWGISKPPTATVGSNAAEGLYYEPDADQEIFQRNSFDTGVFNGDFGWGNRYDLGYVDMNNCGWLVSILSELNQNQTYNNPGGVILFDDPDGLLSNYTDVNDDDFDDDRNGNNIYGRDGIDTDVPPDGEPDEPFFPPDTDDRVRFATNFETVKLTNRVSFNGVELMRTARIPQFHDGSNFELLYGVRFLQVKDRFTILGTGGDLDSTFMNTTIENQIVGPQVGFRWSLQRQRWVISAEGRFLAGFNFQNGNQRWTYASEIDTPAIRNAAPLTSNTVRNESTADEFSPTGELRFNSSYYLTKSFALKVGYSILYVDGVQRAADSVVYSLPNFGITTRNNDGYILANGLSFGIEFNR